MAQLILNSLTRVFRSAISSDSSTCTGKKVIAVAGILLGSGLVIVAYTQLRSASLAGRVVLGVGICVAVSSGVVLVVASRRVIRQEQELPPAPPAPPAPKKMKIDVIEDTGESIFAMMNEGQKTKALRMLADLDIAKTEVIIAVANKGIFIGMSGAERSEALSTFAKLDIERIYAIIAVADTPLLYGMTGSQILVALQVLVGLTVEKINVIAAAAVEGSFTGKDGGCRLSALQGLC